MAESERNIETRKSRRVRITTGIGAAVASAWAVITTFIGVANLPADAGDAWKAVVSAPEYIPFGLAALFIGTLIWSFWPFKGGDAPVIASGSDEAERLYREELARRRAVLRAQEEAEHEASKRKLIRNLGLGNIGDLWEESEKDRKAEAEARRQRLIREASEPPPPPAGRAFIGTMGAALFGVDSEKSMIVIDIKNFGQSPAHNVRWKANAGWFSKQPENTAGGKEGFVGITEPDHAQNITLILNQPVRSRDISGFERGGAGIYAVAQIDYDDMNGESHTRRIAYCLDPEGHELPDRLMLSVCPTGNDEIPGRPEQQRGLPDWMEGRTRLTIAEVGCLAARVSPLSFEKSEKARSRASDLRYYVMRGRIPVAGEHASILAARRGVGRGLSIQVPEVTFETYVTVRDLEHFLDKSLAVWLDVQEEATWRKPNE